MLFIPKRCWCLIWKTLWLISWVEGSLSAWTPADPLSFSIEKTLFEFEGLTKEGCWDGVWGWEDQDVDGGSWEVNWVGDPGLEPVGFWSPLVLPVGEHGDAEGGAEEVEGAGLTGSSLIGLEGEVDWVLSSWRRQMISAISKSGRQR